MEFEVIRSKRRSIGIEVKQNKLIIRAPMQTTNEEINAAMLKHKAWIEKHLAKAQVQKQASSSMKILTDSEIKVLADRAMEVIPERVKHYAPLVGVTYGRITIEDTTEYIAWFCGHWHINKRIDDMHFLFHQFESSEAIQEIAMTRRFSN